MDKKYYYKAMDKDMKCRDFQFKVGETYTIDSKELRLCSDRVFHFCKKLEDTIGYYNSSTDRHFLIEVLGDIVTKEAKSGSNKIRIVREISKTEIEEHIQDKDSYNAKRFLASYTTNVEMLEKLAIVEDELVLLELAKNLNTPVYILEKLAKDKSWYVQLTVAQNSNTPKNILKELSKDDDNYIRRVVAENPNTPVYILIELSKDKNWEVRYSSVENPNIPVYLLEESAKDEDWRVRLAVTENRNTPIYVLEELAKDKYKIISEKAQERLKEITQ